ncbi:PREDICTED: uncharacterized protein LOC104375419, partial [Tauraco erythrolophus]|uniref:uncharacterized protein LOC104375419 n=1 Tax=Tauraco erythrolophus TaxID=121530 RepID=UPI0005235B87
NERVSDGRCSDASSLHVDLSSLVTWAHSHGTICNQIPALGIVQNMGYPSKDNSVLWICGVGHAYHWQCGKLYVRRREENETVEMRKRSASSEASSREDNLHEKRFRMTPSFKRAKAEAASTGSCSRSPGVTQQRDNIVYIIHNEPLPEEIIKNSKSVKSCFGAEQHLSLSGGEVKTDRHKVKLESNDDLQILSDEDQRVSDEDDQGDRINQHVLSEAPVQGVTAEVDLQMHRSQKTALKKQTALHGSVQIHSPVRRSEQEAVLPLSRLALPGRAGWLVGNTDVSKKWEKKRSRNSADIKIFKDWLVLHCPSETREIYELPPEDLDNYLASFYSSTKRQNGADFSASSLHFLQSNIERYLKDHNYEYSVVKGLEFRASQEALKLKHRQLSQKQREGEWSILENLTEEDVESLRRSGLLSKAHPQAFLYLMLTNIVRGFGAGTHRQSHNLYWGQLVLKKSEGELEYLEWKDNLSAEVNTEELGPRLFAKPDNPEHCPVADYKDYAKRRPLDMLHDYDPLYLAPKPLCSIWDQIWYCRKSLAKAKLEKILKVIIQQVRGSVKSKK